MLDSDTKRRIDTARDILVGKVPDPKSQVEQITLALIYKFMADMDAESENLGGKRTFFTGAFARYGWARLMEPSLGSREMLGLYGEGIARMPENPGIPPLFRDIFKNAYLPYRDPETLKRFLEIINAFSYDHSERLGDAFEYLLSILGAQGDAGQFRTPRHIIDFMVEVLDPQKDETILDPACGTAGFLISAWKHVLAHNASTPKPSPPAPLPGGEVGGEGEVATRPGDLLTPDERGRLAKHFTGYDISPDMVRLSRVNLHLHGFADPRIYEYDTLTSEERWNECADVILANPPFMSPKGGIRPHKRFSSQARRSEVLFVDYMVAHLAPDGRAGIIVPEGILFQSQIAYKALRKMLVENALVAVVSLPAGCFNPYSGVKTSILILDKPLARQGDTIAFIKVGNDGFSLGAQRRAIAKNDLPAAFAAMMKYKGGIQKGEDVLAPGFTSHPASFTVVPKSKISAHGDYNLSGERYREGAARAARFAIVPLGDIAEVVAGQSPPGESYNERGAGTPFYQGKTEFGEMFLGDPTTWTTRPLRFAEGGDILLSVRAPVGPVNLATQRVCIGRGLVAIRPAEDRLLSSYAFYFLKSQEAHVKGIAGAVFASINRGDIEKLPIPLPPLEEQKKIVAEIEDCRKVIQGARAVLEAYRPRILIQPDWPMERFGDVTATITPPAKIRAGDFNQRGRYPVLDQSQKAIAGRTDEASALIDGTGGLVIFGDHTCAVKFVCEHFAQGADGIKIIKPGAQLEPKFVYFYLLGNPIEPDGYKRHFGMLKKSRIAIPPLATQRAIVAEIEAEQALVAANRELITRFRQKIQGILARVWRKAEGRMGTENTAIP